MKYLITGLFVLCFLFIGHAQMKLNFEFQAYPTGFIPGLRLENQLNHNTKMHLRLGMNFFDHRDWGVHDDEQGKGFGFTLGASKSIKNSKFDLGIRNDVWFNKVDWKDFSLLSIEKGQTDIVVLQPTAELTYRLAIKQVSIRPSLAFGLEWNVKTDGEPTGEGPILLLGFIIGKL